MQGYKRIVQI